MPWIPSPTGNTRRIRQALDVWTRLLLNVVQPRGRLEQRHGGDSEDDDQERPEPRQDEAQRTAGHVRRGGRRGDPQPEPDLPDPENRRIANILGDEGHLFRVKRARVVDEVRELYCEVRPFTNQLVHVTLRNPRYAGLETARRSYTKARHGNKRPTVTVSSREFPAIVTPEEFELVQRSLKDRRTYGDGWGRIDRNPLAGIVRCPSCDTPMLTKSTGTDTMYYGCMAKGCVKGTLYRFDFAHQAVLRAMREIAAQQVDETELSVAADAAEVRRLNQVLDELMTKEENLAQALVIPEDQGGLSPLLYAKLNKQVLESIASTKKQIQSLRKRENFLPKLREVLFELGPEDPEIGTYFRASFEAVWFKIDRVVRRTKYLSVAKAILIDGTTWGNEEPTKAERHRWRSSAVRPSRDELASLLESHTYSAIARMYEVSDTAVRKWCLKYGLAAKVARRNSANSNLV